MSKPRSHRLAADRPSAIDGRPYPEHLRGFEQYDNDLLPLVSEAPGTFDDLARRLTDPRLQAALAPWLTSAEWRGLVERAGDPPTGPRRYVPARHAAKHLHPAA